MRRRPSTGQRRQEARASSRIRQQRAVHTRVLHTHAGNTLHDARPRNIVEPAVDHPDVGDLTSLQAANVEGVFALPAGDVLHLDMAHDWIEASLGALLVMEVYGEHCISHLPYRDVPHVDVLQPPASRRVVLEPQRAVEVGTVHAALLREDVANPAGDLASDGHSAVTIPHFTLAHDDVLTGHGNPAAIGVAPALDRNAVVT